MVGELWLFAAFAFAALCVAAVWFIRRDAVISERLHNANDNLKAHYRVREIQHETLQTSRSTRNDFIRDRLHKTD